MRNGLARIGENEPDMRSWGLLGGRHIGSPKLGVVLVSSVSLVLIDLLQEALNGWLLQ